MPLAGAQGDPVVSALHLAYPGLLVSAEGTHVSTDGTRWLEIGDMSGSTPQQRLVSPTIREQFYYRYPLEFDLEARREAWVDPGRIRNDGFFRALYFNDRTEAQRSLAGVSQPGVTSTPFQMTQRHDVDCQMQAALAALAQHDASYRKYFETPGGSFNWRVISGTRRLSAHSFGIAFDINTQIAPYWKWTGAKQGRVGDFTNRIPEDLVATMEEYGFIWGGKWHHFDAMHFEYRPELILYSRLVADRDDPPT